MRTTERTSRFKRDYKREARGQYRETLAVDLIAILELLARDETPDPKYRDHALAGEWADHRDCHVRPDLVLIYQKPDDQTLRLVRIGSHSELGL